MYKWHHEVDPRWLKARKQCLTATDIVNLLPEYKRMMKRPGEISLGCASLLAEKLSDSELDCSSVNAAARGHVLEPYAVEEFNYNYDNSMHTNWYHWDDRLIYDDSVVKGFPLAFSPDALPIRQPKKIKIPAVQYGLDQVKELLEIKCYEPKKYMQAFLADPKDLNERYQITVGMMLLENCITGYLFFYCPTLKQMPMFCRKYSRNTMGKEIETVEGIYKMFNDTASQISKQIPQTNQALYTEDQIYQDMLEDEMDIFSLKGNYHG